MVTVKLGQPVSRNTEEIANLFRAFLSLPHLSEQERRIVKVLGVAFGLEFAEGTSLKDLERGLTRS